MYVCNCATFWGLELNTKMLCDLNFVSYRVEHYPGPKQGEYSCTCIMQWAMRSCTRWGSYELFTVAIIVLVM